MGCTSSKSKDPNKAIGAKTPPAPSGLPQADRDIIKKVLDFWFGAEEQPGWDRNSPAAWGMKKWFSSTPETDQWMTTNFQGVIEEMAGSGGGKFKVSEWDKDRDGLLAKIILCDQFSRNVFRK